MSIVLSILFLASLVLVGVLSIVVVLEVLSRLFPRRAFLPVSLIVVSIILGALWEPYVRLRFNIFDSVILLVPLLRLLLLRVFPKPPIFKSDLYEAFFVLGIVAAASIKLFLLTSTTCR